MIYCIWYPPGSGGHFVAAVLSLFGQGFQQPNDQHIKISSTGDAHAISLTAPKYLYDPDCYEFQFDPHNDYAVLIDNGWDETRTKFLDTFSPCKVIKICYTDQSWPVIARSMIEKAQGLDLHTEMIVESDLWPSEEDWARREKYFLYLRDHSLRNVWRQDKNFMCLYKDDVLDYQRLTMRLTEFGLTIKDFKPFWKKWFAANSSYFQPVLKAQEIIQHITSCNHRDISDIDDIWTQAVVNYFIWIEWKFEVPANDYAAWFTNTKDIYTMLQMHGVDV